MTSPSTISPTTTASASVDSAATLLPAATAMDAVTLHVADLARMSGYYRDALGLVELDNGVRRTDVGAPGRGVVVLGRGAVPLVVLTHTPDLPTPRAGQAGLFHTALLFTDRPALARAVASAAAHPLSVYVGSADHLVSQAFYFTDPEGNGIELYWDRPRAQWQWDGGRVRMASLPLDPRAFLSTHLERDHPIAPTAGDAEVGHVHLKVGDIPTARDFYVGTLGFAITADLGTALFVSAGGYHHHMGMNTWESAGAGPRAATIGLGQVSITVPGRADLQQLGARLSARAVDFQDDGRTLRLLDPWNSLLEISAVDA
ncbi:VOC family protein [Nakamurella flavida]|uniref:VOC family protein n=1 Tax=Nakamurella flavida TaxID=363630 RepID=A0A939C140_9ACTN|nr:VOC family protein [Nakamurella flavida]MBM9475050.1 VOC family protein [Nakamurella flavida]MDP9776618.1 catechol 2,3-dioxygenase [Nakamurella flavida]